jgi:hypothetical protein
VKVLANEKNEREPTKCRKTLLRSKSTWKLQLPHFAGTPKFHTRYPTQVTG